MKSSWLVLIVLCIFFLSCHNDGKKIEGEKVVSDSTKVLLEALNKRISDNESDPLLYNQRARVYLLDQQFDKALKDINKALSLAPDSPQLYITLSDVYLLMGQTKNCEGALKQALSLQPGNNAALLRMAKLHLVLRDYPATFDDVQKALKVEPVNPQAYFTRAIALLEKGDTVSAVYDLKKAVDQDQHYYEAYLELGELYAMKKDNMAAAYIKNALNVRPASKEALYMLGMFYQENGQYDKAIETYATLSLVDSTYRNAPYNTGYIYLVYLKDFKLAIQFFSEAIKRDREYAEAWFNRGYAYELSGDFKNAYSDYQQVLKLKVNYEKAIEGLNRLEKKGVIR